LSSPLVKALRIASYFGLLRGDSDRRFNPDAAEFVFGDLAEREEGRRDWMAVGRLRLKSSELLGAENPFLP
jgi:hypothetical protein